MRRFEIFWTLLDTINEEILRSRLDNSVDGRESWSGAFVPLRGSHDCIRSKKKLFRRDYNCINRFYTLHIQCFKNIIIRSNYDWNRIFQSSIKTRRRRKYKFIIFSFSFLLIHLFLRFYFVQIVKIVNQNLFVENKIPYLSCFSSNSLFITGIFSVLPAF